LGIALAERDLRCLVAENADRTVATRMQEFSSSSNAGRSAPNQAVFEVYKGRFRIAAAYEVRKKLQQKQRIETWDLVCTDA
jgi:hypothetical protein